jgi:hypothetical protein
VNHECLAHAQEILIPAGADASRKMESGECADNGVSHMVMFKRNGPVIRSLTTEERQQRLHEEIRNLRSSMRHLVSDETLLFAVMIELRELELASLRELPSEAEQEIADAGPDAA